MRSRWTRLALLALLFLALPPGASLAAGLQAEAVSCCCSGDRPTAPVELRADAPSCCKVSDGSSLPTTAPATCPPEHSYPAVAVCDDAGTSVDAIATGHTNIGVEPDCGNRPPPSLFTLHAAFLI